MWRKTMQWDFYPMTEEKIIIIVTVRQHDFILYIGRENRSLVSYADWSNFEIGDLNFYRGEAYMKYFEFLDQAGGFYYEV